MSLGCSDGTAQSCQPSNAAIAPSSEVHSAARAPSEDWQKRFDSGIEPFQATGRTVKASTQNYDEQIDISALPVWPWSNKKLMETFRVARDERPYVQRGFPGFQRRAPWLYPFDGCWVRAASAAQSIERSGVVRPGKIFVFGPLRFRTKFSTKGIVYWWYHVAPAYRIGNQAVVLDPTVSPNTVIPLATWLAKITKNPNRVRISVCDSYAYYTGSKCVGGEPRQERWLPGQVQTYLRRERVEVVKLKMNPEEVLGESPPWSTGEIQNSPIATSQCE